MAKLPRYNISMNPKDFPGDEKLGMDAVAYTSKPALLKKGIALDAKQLTFKDEMLYRVAAPALIPDLAIYRSDEELGEYEVVFSKEVIEEIRADFMLNKKKFMFNIEHDEDVKAPSYILDSWITGPSKTDPSFTKYGIKVPENSWFVVSQFTDKKFFINEILNKDRAAYSIEGFLGLALIQLKEKLKMEKSKLELENENTPVVETVEETLNQEETQKFEMAKLADGTPIWISVLEVDGEVYTVDEAMEKVAIVDGEYELSDGTKFTTVSGKISEITPVESEEAPKEEAPKEETEEMAKPEETPEEEAPVVEAPVEEESSVDEAAILAVVQPKFDEILAVIAELKTKIETADSTKEPEEVAMDGKERLTSVLSSFNKFNK